MTGADSMTVGKKKTSISLVFIMLFSACSMLANVPNATAVEQIVLAIIHGQSPVEDRFYSAFDLRYPLAQRQFHALERIQWHL